MGSQGDHDEPGAPPGKDPSPKAQGTTQRSINDKPVLPAGQPIPVLLLICTDGQLGRGEMWPLFNDAIVLGRETLKFAGQELSDSRMSRRHAQLRRDGDRWLLMDLASTNGTHVDGGKLQEERAIGFGTLIRMGNTLLLLAVRSVGADHRPPPDSELIGDSPAIRAVRDAIAKVAGHDSNVLITGETGVGKEVAARAIHRMSGRPGALMAINCGGLSAGVLESQLFGHVRGAFTGAVSHQEGVFRAAHGGTLLLDELGEMPLELQVKLLRAIEARAVQPVGAATEEPVDVRILAATNCDVAAAVRQGRLRADLYARLAQWTIDIPPLRQRRDDLPLLVPHLLTRLGAGGRSVEALFMEALVLHTWPFNVRGLLNVIKSTVITMPPGEPLALRPEIERTLEMERDLKASTGEAEVAMAPVPSRLGTRSEPGKVPEPSVLEAALRLCYGNVAEAARYLRCSRQQLYRWIRAYDISLEPFRDPRS